jgi:hypothetical protein
MPHNNCLQNIKPSSVLPNFVKHPVVCAMFTSPTFVLNIAGECYKNVRILMSTSVVLQERWRWASYSDKWWRKWRLPWRRSACAVYRQACRPLAVDRVFFWQCATISYSRQPVGKSQQLPPLWHCRCHAGPPEWSSPSIFRSFCAITVATR